MQRAQRKMRPLATPKLRSFVAAAALAAAVGAIFWVPSQEAAHGFFPAPLDDVYILFDVARSLARGHPFEWLPGNGYSSGETSPLYAVVLAIGYGLGFHGRLLGVWAAIVAVLAVASFVRSVQLVARPCPRWLAGGIALLLLSVGIVDWSLFSGMEVATFAAALGRMLLALARTRAPIDERGGLTRERAQWHLGAWGAVAVLLRPEAGVLVGVFAIIAARGAARRSGLAALLRCALPGLAVTLLVLGVNRLATGTAQSAGAQLKLLSSNPYLSDVDRSRAYVENLITFAIKGLRAELSVVRVLGLVVPALAVAALVPRERRPVAAACLAGALAWILLVSFNNNAPFHNFRYYAPALLLVLVAAASGAAAIAQGLGRRAGPMLAGALVASAIIVAGARIPAQVQHFARAAGNIRDQQIEVAVRLSRTMEPGARVLLGDAGAIPFVSDRAALDALGLGGYHRMPFARAAVNGEASTVELIERLEPEERPAYLALYPNWFGAITSRFGVELDRVTLTDNLICAGPTKVIYRADWSALDTPAGVREASATMLDELDVADVISEAEHGYTSPAPNGGWTTLDILADDRGRPRFDGGRIIPAGGTESFVVARRGEGARDAKRDDAQRVRIVVRIDEGTRGLRVHTPRATADLLVSAKAPGGARAAWREASTVIDALAPGDVITLEATSGEYRNYHVWITAEAQAAALTR
ncbi:MAG: hypothetical protein JWO86_2833 [Myxococcaceae bacterium]|nr:hypothetical protein [Myxococcaceae bacterium]